MNIVDNVRDLNVLLTTCTDLQIKSTCIKPLTQIGDNYGSTIVAVDVNLENGKYVYFVLKMLPTNEFIKKLFNTSVTFKNEIAFYKIIVPSLNEFQFQQQQQYINNGITFIPKFCSSRLNISTHLCNKQNNYYHHFHHCVAAKLEVINGIEITDDAVLVLENLKMCGFENVIRSKGFDFDTSMLVIATLARFHAIPLAMKLQDQCTFQTKIMPYLREIELFKAQHLIDKLMIIAEEFLEFKPLLTQIEANLKQPQKFHVERDIFATIVHNDFWINNVMIKFDKSKYPLKCKIVDFQICSYNSLAKDLVFFLFSSIKDEVIVENYDYFVNFYYSVFIKTLNDLKCNTNQFTFDLFVKEIAIEAKQSQFSHILFMLNTIFASQEDIGEREHWDETNFLKNVTPSESYKNKFVMVVREFSKRNWI